MKKVVGYVAVLAGFVLVASSRVPTLFDKLDFLPKIFLDFVAYVGLGLFAFGIIVFLMDRNRFLGGSKEVPIYRGKQIVGYRRH